MKCKRIFAAVLALSMTGAFCACAGKESSALPGSTEQTGATTETEIETETTKEPQTSEETKDNEEMPYAVKENYLPEGLTDLVAEKLKSEASLFNPYVTGNAPYAKQDVFGISNCRLLSVSVPVYKVGKADRNGDYRLTLFVLSNQLAEMKQNTLRSYAVRINREQYGLKDNSDVFRMIKVDLSDYNIVLSERETLAYFDPQDTLYPAYIGTGSNAVREELAKAFPQTLGMFSKVGTDKLGVSNITLFFDFEMERTYESRSAYEKLEAEKRTYDAMLRGLKEKYEGKYLSILGDSISTFKGVSNDSSYNHTIGNNAVYYQPKDLPGWQYTYWGRVMAQTGMKLCVDNAWSGARVYGRADTNYADAAPLRATELDNDNGTPDNPADDIKPDVILFYMGTNDLATSPFGELYDRLSAVDEAQWQEQIDVWFKALLEKTDNATDLVAGETYTSFEQAYALSLYRMVKAYPDAEIFCLNIMRTEVNDHEKVVRFNRCIRALTAYFGVNLLDQYGTSGMSPANHHSYTMDAACLHPNAAGHFRMAQTILSAMGKREQTET